MLLEKNRTQIKMIDFGISRKLRPNEPTKETFGTPEFVGKLFLKHSVIYSNKYLFSSGSHCIRTGYISNGYVEYWCNYIYFVS